MKFDYRSHYLKHLKSSKHKFHHALIEDENGDTRENYGAGSSGVASRTSLPGHRLGSVKSKNGAPKARARFWPHLFYNMRTRSYIHV